MVHWFSPMVLLKVVKNVIVSTIFGQYADRRLINAALDVSDDDTTLARTGGQKGVLGEKEGPIWLDYVADLGDGFDSTYAVAYMLGQRELPVAEERLPRGDCLIMGGDEVYPDASRDDYQKRLKRPYEAAFPRSNQKDAVRPRVYLIPGNHDWYDGLTLFLANFCRGRSTPLGSWNATQNRSYFAVHLRDNWWVWGYDSQLGEDIDKPQADYFVSVAKQMKPGAKVIVCASVPSWLRAEISAADRAERDVFYRGLDYIAGIIRNECTDAKVPLVVSGDLHHYSRYVADVSGTTFITAGGGGAFLHPTHQLPEKITAYWASTRQNLQIGNSGSGKRDDDACYPPRSASRKLVLGNLKFALRNFDFSLTLGFFYWLAALAMLAWDGYGASGGTGSFLSRLSVQLATLTPTPVFVMVLAAFGLAIFNYADIRSKPLKFAFGGIHGLIHVAILTVAAAFSSVLISPVLGVPLGQIAYFVLLFGGMMLAGFLGGFVWGLYLLIASYFRGDHANDAFSAMRLDSFRHFLRLKIEGDELTVYPIGIDRSPRREDWQKNPGFVEGDQNTPFFVPKRGLDQRLIEAPVLINVNSVRPLKAAI